MPPDIPKKANRSYSDHDLKLLFGLSALHCAFPECAAKCHAPGDEDNKDVIYGDIAHIVAHGKQGPRANPNFPPEKLNRYDNLILLCKNHHAIVDGQESRYSIEELKIWKINLEDWVEKQFLKNMPFVNFSELDIVAKAIIANPTVVQTGFHLITPEDKIALNQLSEKIRGYIQIGMLKVREVEQYIQGVAILDSQFPQRLISGFVTRYQSLRTKQLSSDDIFLDLVDFAQQGETDYLAKSARLAVLTYLFNMCHIFES